MYQWLGFGWLDDGDEDMPVAIGNINCNILDFPYQTEGKNKDNKKIHHRR